MEPAFLANIGYYRRYKFDGVRDLLRVMRNKSHHYRELPQEIQELVGPVPEGFYGYFDCRFPRLFIEVYKVVSRHCREEEFFQRASENSMTHLGSQMYVERKQRKPVQVQNKHLALMCCG
ncbi:hypothetical protein V6N13_044180 [Hibiscus sabdariffa]|uniref:KEN domain-containing protein n=1 Tax=Hibiscus sabdariffa TaxID=183260 RepID=A0ABR2RHE0_9ROSI